MIINIRGRQLEGSVATRRSDPEWGGRESKAVTVALTYAEAVALFESDTPWSITIDAMQEDGTTRVTTDDMSDYAISGPITDNRNGTVTIRMGRYREEELLATALAASPDNHQQAQSWRCVIKDALQGIEDDALALAVAPLYPEWGEFLVGTEMQVGMRVRYEGKLYKVITAHKASADWEPGHGTESLYARIDETNAGTVDDPIPYEGNMALVSGLHYSQDGAVYLCNRDTINPVHNALADLVGLYVEVVA